MNNTVQTFKKQQVKTQAMLQNLSAFIQAGLQFGLEPDDTLMQKLSTAVKSADETMLKVALIGGFSEGKTSIASAWLEKLDDTMNISQQESSNEVKIYHVGDDIELIDTPGLFGFKEQENNEGQIEKYKEITKKYVSEAHLVLYVMNPANPIKESHKEDLVWLFRDLNLLPRTVFVLSRFDEVADIEDDWDYRENLKTKKANVINRLKEIISLTPQEENQLNIVGVSANPFGEGTEYWLNNLDEFKKLSRIVTLQDATRETISRNGGLMPIVFEAQKSMIQDVLTKQMPKVAQKQELILKELSLLGDTAKHLNNEMAPLAARINNAQDSLIEFVRDHFSSLIKQVQGTDLHTFKDFFENEIGKDGIVLSTNIELEFNRQCQAVSSTLERLSIDFNNEILRFEESVGSTVMSYGFDMLKKVKLDNNTILAARDGIRSIGKTFGADLSQWMKFKPWGAANMAAKVNAAIAFVGLVMEAYDSYKKVKAEDEFRQMVHDIVENFETQRKGLLDSLKQNFADNVFPEYKALKDKFDKVNIALSKNMQRKESFEEWQKQGQIIEAEYQKLEDR